jgi:glycosyltransferase involved in cell wall biosynthesis
MKVLHVIPAVAPRYGGPSRAVFEMCRAIKARGADVEIVTTDADGPGHLAVEVGAQLNHQGVPTTFFPRQLSETYGYSRPLGRWLRSNVGRFDVVHIHAVFSHPCLAAAKACRMNGVPYVVRPLGSLDPWSMRQKPWRKGLMWRLGVGRMLRRATAIHYTTAEEMRLAEDSLGLKRGVVVPLGIELGEMNAQQDRASFGRKHPAFGDGDYVLSLSRLHPKKNLESLVEAFVSLVGRPEFRDWKLALAGDGDADYVAGLKRLASDSGKRIIFTGWLSGDEKAAALRHASLLALPSRQENFGLCVAEALACGTPVIVSPYVNLASEIERIRAGWVAGLTGQELASVLSDAMSDAGERKRRGRAGREFILNNFTWTKVAAELTDLYNNICARVSRSDGEGE